MLDTELKRGIPASISLGGNERIPFIEIRLPAVNRFTYIFFNRYSDNSSIDNYLEKLFVPLSHKLFGDKVSEVTKDEVRGGISNINHNSDQFLYLSNKGL